MGNGVTETTLFILKRQVTFFMSAVTEKLP